MITLAGTLLGKRIKMNKNKLDQLNNYKKSILTLYLTSGYPDFNSSVEIAQILINSNIDILEIGIPFSDPIANGPTIQNTSFKAIEAKNIFTKNFTEKFGDAKQLTFLASDGYHVERQSISRTSLLDSKEFNITLCVGDDVDEELMKHLGHQTDFGTDERTLQDCLESIIMLI